MKHLRTPAWWGLLLLVGLGVILVVSRQRISDRPAAPSLGAMLARQVEVTAPAVKPFDGKPNREVPAHIPSSQMPQFSKDATDEQIAGSRIFPTRLWPIDGPGAGGSVSK